MSNVCINSLNPKLRQSAWSYYFDATKTSAFILSGNKVIVSLGGTLAQILALQNQPKSHMLSFLYKILVWKKKKNTEN